MAKIDISKLTDTEVFELIQKGSEESKARQLKNLQPMKDSVATDLAKVQSTIDAILKLDPEYKPPFTVNRLERTEDNIKALLKDVAMNRTETIRKFSGASKVVGEWLDSLAKAKTIKATKGTNVKGVETVTYSLPE